MLSMGSECREACSNISLMRKVKSCAFCSECSIYSIKIYCCVHQLLTVFAIAVIKQVLPCERKSFKTNSDMGREWEFLQSGFALCIHMNPSVPGCFPFPVVGARMAWR